MKAFFSVNGEMPKPIGDIDFFTCDNGDDAPYLEPSPLDAADMALEMEIVEIDAHAFGDVFGPAVDHGRSHTVVLERRVPYVAWPRTVRQAKSRPKGNRGNRRRVYDTLVVRTLMPSCNVEVMR